MSLRRAVTPLEVPLQKLADRQIDVVPEAMRSYFRDVLDHAIRVRDQVAALDELLTSILQASLARTSLADNEDMRKISAWAGIIAVPTAIAGIYGMNFRYMPELDWRWGYPLVLLVIALVLRAALPRLQAQRLAVGPGDPTRLCARAVVISAREEPDSVHERHRRARTRSSPPQRRVVQVGRRHEDDASSPASRSRLSRRRSAANWPRPRHATARRTRAPPCGRARRSPRGPRTGRSVADAVLRDRRGARCAA